MTFEEWLEADEVANGFYCAPGSEAGEFAKKAYEAGKLEQATELDAARAEIERKMSAGQFVLEQLAAEQARIKQLLEVLKKTTVALEHRWEVIANRAAPVLEGVIDEAHSEGIIALATPSDTYALEAVVKKAGEVMRERCAQSADDNCHFSTCDSIQLIPAVTLEDLN